MASGDYAATQFRVARQIPGALPTKQQSKAQARDFLHCHQVQIQPSNSNRPHECRHRFQGCRQRFHPDRIVLQDRKGFLRVGRAVMGELVQNRQENLEFEGLHPTRRYSATTASSRKPPVSSGRKQPAAACYRHPVGAPPALRLHYGA
jgi:hypothetical protein